MTAGGRRFLCVGAAHWDIIARSDSPVATGDDLPGLVLRRPGGVALNVAAGLAGSRCDVSLVCVLGNDPDGIAMLEALRRLGIGCGALVLADGATDTYAAIESVDGSLIAAVADARLLTANADVLANRAIGQLEGADTVFLDANLAASGITRITQRAIVQGVEVVVNPVSPAKASRLKRVPEIVEGVAVVCNLAEACVLTGRTDPGAQDAALALTGQGFAAALVTAGAEPAALAGAGYVVTARPPAVPPGASVTGAGDALCAAFLAFPDRATNPEGALNAALQAAAERMRGNT